MTDELFISDKTYVSSKKAAQQTGYAQDYIGQLARGGQIDAQRVGGLWYVNVESLVSYKTQAENFVPKPPVTAPQEHVESVVTFDGRDYISASRAAKITGYNQDYIGQLARSGKILSRQIGNRWYVERNGLIGHKAEKDKLLASVQAESVGLMRPEAPKMPQESLTGEYASAGPVLTYFRDDRDLIPLQKKEAEIAKTMPAVPAPMITVGTPSPIKIKPVVAVPKRAERIQKRHVRTSEKTIFPATKAVAALTIVIVLSYGLVSMKDRAVYTMDATPSSSVVNQNSYLASAAEAIGKFGDVLETMLTRDLTYHRPVQQ